MYKKKLAGEGEGYKGTFGAPTKRHQLDCEIRGHCILIPHLDMDVLNPAGGVCFYMHMIFGECVDKAHLLPKDALGLEAFLS